MSTFAFLMMQLILTAGLFALVPVGGALVLAAASRIGGR